MIILPTRKELSSNSLRKVSISRLPVLFHRRRRVCSFFRERVIRRRRQGRASTKSTFVHTRVHSGVHTLVHTRPVPLTSVPAILTRFVTGGTPAICLSSFSSCFQRSRRSFFRSFAKIRIASSGIEDPMESMKFRGWMIRLHL